MKHAGAEWNVQVLYDGGIGREGICFLLFLLKLSLVETVAGLQRRRRAIGAIWAVVVRMLLDGPATSPDDAESGAVAVEDDGRSVGRFERVDGGAVDAVRKIVTVGRSVRTVRSRAAVQTKLREQQQTSAACSSRFWTPEALNGTPCRLVTRPCGS